MATSVALGSMAVLSPRAFAADAQVDHFTARYTVAKSGVLHVEETVVYRFGDLSERHGIERTLVTREPDTGQHADEDLVYTISHLKVSSPDSEVNTEVERSTVVSDDGRDRSVTYRIGSEDETVDAETATYLLSYVVKGAIRHFPGYDEFFWDATGFGWQEPIEAISATAKVPGGAEGAKCFSGPPGSTKGCDRARVEDGTASFAASDLAVGDGVTIDVKIASGRVSANTPNRQPAASGSDESDPSDQTDPGEPDYPYPADQDADDSSGPSFAAVAGVGAGLLAVVLAGVAWSHRPRRDLRYLDVPPGVIPADVGAARVGRSPRGLQIPVAFTPPAGVSVAEAGFLVDGVLNTRETAATLVDLAVRKIIRVDDPGEPEAGEYQLELLTDDRSGLAAHEKALLDAVFEGSAAGTVCRLAGRGSIGDAHIAMGAAVRRSVRTRAWFTETLAVRSVGHRMRRNATGRAYCDRVEGFRTYLATTEADQLRFEEGEDIFNRYLPWAIAFDLADRWARICRELVAAGRIPDVQPFWFAGTGVFDLSTFDTGLLVGSLTDAVFTPPAPTDSGWFGGTGFGSDSSGFGGGFGGDSGGGGSSGDGGGGGGGGGW